MCSAPLMSWQVIEGSVSSLLTSINSFTSSKATSSVFFFIVFSSNWHCYFSRWWWWCTIKWMMKCCEGLYEIESIISDCCSGLPCKPPVCTSKDIICIVPYCSCTCDCNFLSLKLIGSIQWLSFLGNSGSGQPTHLQ